MEGNVRQFIASHGNYLSSRTENAFQLVSINYKLKQALYLARYGVLKIIKIQQNVFELKIHILKCISTTQYLSFKHFPALEFVVYVACTWWSSLRS